MRQNKNLLPLESAAKIVGHVQRVLFHLWHSHGSALKFFVVRRVGLSRSPLIPFDNGEGFLPGSMKSARQRNESDARSALEDQKNRIAHVLAPHFDPLIDATDTHSLETVDASWRRNGPFFGNRVLQICSVEKGGREHRNDQTDQSASGVFENTSD